MATKILMGLGNPGPEYQDARHNVGWLFLDWLAGKVEASGFKEDKYYDAYVAKGKMVLNGKKATVLFVKPQTYVNKSGFTAGKLKAKLKLKAEDFFLIHDDMDIPFGRFKLSFEKNAAGHHGVESVSKALKTIKYWRLRMGTENSAVRKAHQKSDKARDELVIDFVLGKFTKGEFETLKKEVYKDALERLEVKK
jgi:PTH1 family peptidyl-tRNA hydrolase